MSEPPLESFLRDSQTVMASLKSPRMVANSARRLCCDGGDGVLVPMNDEVDDRGKDATDELGLWVGVGEGEGDPKSLLVEENSLEGKRRLLEKDSLQSKTFFSIQGIRHPITNSLTNLDVCWMSPCINRSELSGTGSEVLAVPLAFVFFVVRIIGGESGTLGHGSRGIGCGTGTAGGGGDDKERGNRYTSMPNCFLTALNSALASSSDSDES